MVRQTQKINQLRQPEGVLGESPLCQQKEEVGRGWFSRIATFFKGLGRPRVDNQVREEVVRDGGAIFAKTRDPVVESIRVRSNNTSKTGRKSPGKTVRAPASKNKAKSKTV
ncbi:MAG: hypothetical protein EB120_11900 [Proteobacteria bacterium]|nr:hypothetical protein [Pseudomonadota bacterium]